MTSSLPNNYVVAQERLASPLIPDQPYKFCACISRLKKMPQSMPEYALTRNYLELMVELPWNKTTKGKRFYYC